MASSRRARRLRWLAPVAVIAVIGLAAFVPTLSSAATPDLPTLTPQQLLAKVQQSKVQAFSGTFQLTTDLGIPNVSGLQGQVDTASLAVLVGIATTATVTVVIGWLVLWPLGDVRTEHRSQSGVQQVRRGMVPHGSLAQIDVDFGDYAIALFEGPRVRHFMDYDTRRW